MNAISIGRVPERPSIGIASTPPSMAVTRVSRNAVGGSTKPAVAAATTVAAIHTSRTGSTRRTRTASQPLGGSRPSSRSRVCSTTKPAQAATPTSASQGSDHCSGAALAITDRPANGRIGNPQCSEL